MAAVQPRNLLAQRQPQPVAVVVAAPVQALKGLEQFVQVGGVDADAVVGTLTCTQPAWLWALMRMCGTRPAGMNLSALVSRF